MRMLKRSRVFAVLTAFIAVVIAAVTLGSSIGNAQETSEFASLLAVASETPDVPSMITAPFFQVCEDLGDDARLRACERGLDASRSDRLRRTWQIRIRGNAVLSGPNYLVRVGQYDPIYRRIPLRVGPIIFRGAFHDLGNERGVLSTVPSESGRFPDVATFEAFRPEDDEDDGSDWVNRHHSTDGLAVDLIFRLGARWVDRSGTGTSSTVREGFVMDVLAIRIVDEFANGEVIAERRRTPSDGLDAGARPSEDVAISPSADGAVGLILDGASSSDRSGWPAPLSLSTLGSLGASREVVMETLERAGGVCAAANGGFRGATATVCRGLGASLGLERQSAEVTVVFDHEHLVAFLVALGVDDDRHDAVDGFRGDLAFWSTRFAQTPPAGRHDHPEVVRYPIGVSLVRLSLLERRGGGYLRSLMVEDRQWAERQDAISRGSVPGVSCGLRGSLDERAIDCARSNDSGGVGAVAVRIFEVTRPGDRRHFERYRLITQTASGGRVWYHHNGRSLIASMPEPTTLADAFLRCAATSRWAGVDGFRPGGLWGTPPTLDGASVMAQLFPEMISSERSEWFWEGRAYGNEVSMQLGAGAGTGRTTSFERVTRGSTSNRLRYFCQSNELEGRAPAMRERFDETEVDSVAPCGLSGTIDARQAECVRILGAAAYYQRTDASSASGRWQVISQTVLGERVWREPDVNRIWFQVPDLSTLEDAQRICADPGRATDRRVSIPLRARLPSGAEYRDAWATGLFNVISGEGAEYWSSSARPGRILLQTPSGGVLWQDPHARSTPRVLPFYCVADVPR